MSRTKEILVIDDNEDIGEVVRAVAERAKMSCTVTTSVDAFLAALTAETDLIFLDMKMPEMNGREMMELLAVHHCSAGIVLMSGLGSSVLGAAEGYGRGLGLKMVGTLPKPFRVAELSELLRKQGGGRAAFLG